MAEAGLSQAERPQGLAGRAFGLLMEQLSAANYGWVVEQLAPLKPRSYLEIGFGTGRLAEMVAETLKPERIVGVDPAPLMRETAQKKLRRFARKTKIDLRLGDDTALDTIEGPFDAIAATHSFQFWQDPAATLARIHVHLASPGRLALVLRRHDGGSRSVPNPISRSADELGGTRKALAAAGFHIILDETLKTGSHGFIAVHGGHQ